MIIMLESFEKIADKIADYIYWPKQKKHKKTIKKEEINSVFYEIVPYYKNDFDYKIFAKLLKNFSSFSERINFFVLWNNQVTKLVVSFPDKMEEKFKTRFYNYFPSSSLKKLNYIYLSNNKYYSVLEKNDFEQYICADEKIKIKDNNIFQEIFYLFQDIPNNEISAIRYSLVLNSKEELSNDDIEEEIKWLLPMLWDGFVAFLKLIYAVLYRILTGSKLELKKKENVKTWISWTALSIWLNWNISWIYYSTLKNYLQNSLKKQESECFSQVTITEFSKLFHVPTKEEKINTLSYINYKRLAPPPNLPDESEDITILWTADWADQKQVVGLKQEDKARHVYIVWKTWVGKSTLLSNMVLSDLERWRGLALIDPHWDLIDTVLKIIPENRKDDVVLFDVSDTENPVGFNIFEKWENYNKDLAVSTVLSIFKKLYWHSWGPRLEYIFRNVLLALSDYDDANFLDIMRMLTDKNFRKKVLVQVQDPIIKDFWEKEFAKRSERFASEAISPIMNKVGQFVSSPIIRNIFGQKKSTINMADIMQNNKIFLVNLSKWLIWEDNSAMIGSFIVSGLQVETMKRANLSMEQRKDFTLYIDEFQNFATDSFAVILSEARKYKLSLVVANQYISQVDDLVQNAIFGNVGNIVAFNSWNADAEILAKQFKNQVSVNDITSISKFKAYTKIMIDGSSTDVFGLSTHPISENKYQKPEYVAKLKAISNKKYTVSKEKVEQEIKNSRENPLLIKQEENKKQLEATKQTVKEETKSKVVKVENDDVNDIFEWIVKLKFNYGLFVVAGWYEWLLHKKNINLPEGISWKDYYNIWDKVRVKLVELKEVDGQKKAVWESV